MFELAADLFEVIDNDKGFRRKRGVRRGRGGGQTRKGGKGGGGAILRGDQRHVSFTRKMGVGVLGRVGVIAVGMEL